MFPFSGGNDPSWRSYTGSLVFQSPTHYYLGQEGYVLPCFCLSVCLLVSRITPNVVDEFWWSFSEGCVVWWPRNAVKLLIQAGSQIEARSPIQAGVFRSLVSIEAGSLIQAGSPIQAWWRYSYDAISDVIAETVRENVWSELVEADDDSDTD